jgi:hypothetical protein
MDLSLNPWQSKNLSMLYKILTSLKILIIDNFEINKKKLKWNIKLYLFNIFSYSTKILFY